MFIEPPMRVSENCSGLPNYVPSSRALLELLATHVVKLTSVNTRVDRRVAFIGKPDCAELFDQWFVPLLRHYWVEKIVTYGVQIEDAARFEVSTRGSRALSGSVFSNGAFGTFEILAVARSVIDGGRRSM